MKRALAIHDRLGREAIERLGGRVVKTTGDGFHAAFADPLDAVAAAALFQCSLKEVKLDDGGELLVRCGIHAGVVQDRDGDYFGPDVNRAARIMSIAHGGQMLVSAAVAELVRNRLPGELSLRDLGAVRLRELSATERVFQVLHPSLRKEFPALRSLLGTPNNLSHPITSFVGRFPEIDDITTCIRRHRLVTLCGAGGIGKTRLSLHVAARLLQDFTGGVWFVELASIADERLVASAVASVLGVKEGATHTVDEAVAANVADRPVLFIFDNCEHVINACASHAKYLLERCPHLHVLASSREPLRLPAEMAYNVPALRLPPERRGSDVASLAAYESIQLFVERATAARPSFQLTDSNATEVVDICRRLDGLPLAIELAAAHTRSLSLASILRNLDDRFRLLTAQDRTASPRQRTLRALIDWSYDLLTEDERTLFRQVGVFMGSWTIEAACAAGGVADADQTSLLQSHSAVVEKSLVHFEAGVGRYRMLESIRQYALERLRDAGEEQAVRSRQLAYYLDFAKRAGPGIVSSTQAEWLQAIDLERENLLSVHSWCVQDNAVAEAGLRLLHAIKQYWIKRGLVNLGHRLTVEALEGAGGHGDTLVRCLALFDAGQFCTMMGRYDEAFVYLEESLSIARDRGDDRRISAVLQPLSMASLGRGDLGTARAQIEEALSLSEKAGPDRDVAAALNQLAAICRMQGDLDQASIAYEKVLARLQDMGDEDGAAIVLLNLAIVRVMLGNADAVPPILLDVLDIASRTGSKPLGQFVTDVAAGVAATHGDWRRSARFFAFAEAHASLTGLHRDPADEAFLQPLMSRTRDALGKAEFAAIAASARDVDYEAAMGETRAWLERRASGINPD
jgi:predicted ATPase